MSVVWWMLLGMFLGAGVAFVAFWSVWTRLEQRKQDERLRQYVNGGRADLPSWVRLTQKDKR